MYALYESHSNHYKLACKKFCSNCCTDRILMTSLEGSLIAAHIQQYNLHELLNQVKNIPPDKRYHPKTTINQESYLAYNDSPIPEPEEIQAHTCPFLTNDQCAIYPARPMSCRTMISSVPCQNMGYASMSSVQMSTATLFYQFIEMLDDGGYYGNFLNILEMLMLPADTQSLQLVLTKTPLLKNQRIHYVMIPPEHRDALIPIMNSIQQIFHNK